MFYGIFSGINFIIGYKFSISDGILKSLFPAQSHFGYFKTGKPIFKCLKPFQGRKIFFKIIEQKNFFDSLNKKYIVDSFGSLISFITPIRLSIKI